MQIAVFDYKIVPTNPTGSCHLRVLEGLCQEHEFTVFAVEFENPCPERIQWVRIPVPTRPLFLLFIAFHLLAPLCYWIHCLRYRTRFDLVQMVESNLAFGDISYAHFCHRAYLKEHWPKLNLHGVRAWAYWLIYWLHVLLEPWVFRKVRWIVVPSQGLAREIGGIYGEKIAEKIYVIPNPVDIEHMRCPSDFDRREFRSRLGLGSDDGVLVFVALGQFERKGLPLLLEAIRRVEGSAPKLLIVGGTFDVVALYRRKVKEMGIERQVILVGMQRDVRPYLWASDIFVLPSLYEIFPLVSVEAAAAGLPLLVTPLYGVEEFIRDGENGWVVERTVDDIVAALNQIVQMEREELVRMGEVARESVQIYSTDRFQARWRKFLRQLA